MWKHQEIAAEFASVVQSLVKAWPGTASNADEVAQTREFLNLLGEDLVTRLFDVRKKDYSYFTRGAPKGWCALSLNQFKRKITVHVRAACEALESYAATGYWDEGLSAVKDPPPLLDLVEKVRALRNALDLHTPNSERQIETSLLHQQYDLGGELSPIDTVLFSACQILESGSFSTPEVRDAAEKIVATTLEKHVYGIISSQIKDSANLWWAVKLAVKQVSSSGKAGILDRLPGNSEGRLAKACDLTMLATMLPLSGLEDRSLATLDAYDFTPEIYRPARTHAFVLQNILFIQSELTANVEFRRSPDLWSVMGQLDDIADKALENLANLLVKPKSLNLYLLAQANRALVAWLALGRSHSRWQEIENACSLTTGGSKKIKVQAIKDRLDKKPLKGVATANSRFDKEVRRLQDRMKGYFLNRYYKRPFSIAICGPPGSGKTFIAEKLLAAFDEKAKQRRYGALNLAGDFPDASAEWKDWRSKVKDYCWTGTYVEPTTQESFTFQAFILDEADAVDPNAPGENTHAYQWMLQPLWDKWTDYNSSGGSNEAVPTFVIVIASRYRTWAEWRHSALGPAVNKGRDFVSRIDTNLDFPMLSPDDQLLLAASLMQGIKELSVDAAEHIALFRCENQARTIECFLKQCQVQEAANAGGLFAVSHLPKFGNYSVDALRLRSISS